MNHRIYLSLVVSLFVGCSESSQPTSAPRPAGEVILSCVESSGAKLEAAQAEGTVASAAREIVQTLDDYEDAPAMADFEEFHREMEELEALAAKEATQDELDSKIAEIKALVERLLAEREE